MKSLKLLITRLGHLILWGLMVFLATPVNAFEIVEEEEEVVTVEEPKKNTVYFPQFQMFDTVKNETEMTDEITGTLDLVDECLRVVNKQGTFLIVWPGWYDFTVAGREIVVNKINTGAEVAHLKIGDRIRLSGAELVYSPPSLQFKIPDSCLGPFWAVGEIQSVKTEVPVIKDNPSLPKKHHIKESVKSTKIVVPAKRDYPQKYKSPAQSGKQLKKLEIMLERSILK